MRTAHTLGLFVAALLGATDGAAVVAERTDNNINPQQAAVDDGRDGAVDLSTAASRQTEPPSYREYSGPASLALRGSKLDLPDLFTFVEDFVAPAELREAFYADALASAELEYSFYQEHGRNISSPRRMKWFADDPEWHYPFSKSHGDGLRAHDFSGTVAVEAVRDMLEARLGFRYNACLLNYYEDGDEHASWHSDDDPWLDQSYPISSVTFGATRDFLVRPRESDWMGSANFTVDAEAGVRAIPLSSGSLITMNPGAQDAWRHAVPPSPGAGERINLTFRRIDPAKAHLQKAELLKELWSS